MVKLDDHLGVRVVEEAAEVHFGEVAAAELVFLEDDGAPLLLTFSLHQPCPITTFCSCRYPIYNRLCQSPQNYLRLSMINSRGG